MKIDSASANSDNLEQMSSNDLVGITAILNEAILIQWAKKLGFQEQGKLQKVIPVQGIWQDIIFYTYYSNQESDVRE